MQKFEVKDHEYSILPEGKKWKLVFSDEFDGTVLNENVWNYRLNFWGDRFLAYTDKGVTLDGNSNAVFKPVIVDGMLCSSQLQTGGNSFDDLDLFGNVKNRLETLKTESSTNPQYYIWPLKKLNKPKFAHRFGYYEARIKFQKLPFWWSAFWIQSPSIGAGGNPEYVGVESDIIENFVNGNLTCGNIYDGYSENSKTAGRVKFPYVEDGEFHRVGLEWNKDGYVFYYDGKEVSRTNEPVSQVEQFILLTTEIQGYRKGEPKTTWTEEELNDTFVCDYVRVFDEIE